MRNMNPNANDEEDSKPAPPEPQGREADMNDEKTRSDGKTYVEDAPDDEEPTGDDEPEYVDADWREVEEGPSAGEKATKAAKSIAGRAKEAAGRAKEAATSEKTKRAVAKASNAVQEGGKKVGKAAMKTAASDGPPNQPPGRAGPPTGASMRGGTGISPSSGGPAAGHSDEAARMANEPLSLGFNSQESRPPEASQMGTGMGTGRSGGDAVSDLGFAGDGMLLGTGAAQEPMGAKPGPEAEPPMAADTGFAMVGTGGGMDTGGFDDFGFNNPAEGPRGGDGWL